MVAFIYTGFGSILGIFVTAFITHLLHKDRDIQIQKFIKFDSARRDLEFAFIKVMILLEVKPPVDPAIGNEWQNTGKLLLKFHEKHRLAVWQFKYALTPSKRGSFRKCWNKYCCYDKDTHEATYSDYENEGKEKELKKRDLAISRIKKIVNFTN